PAIVLGVVDDIRHGGLQDEPERVIYMEPAQSLEAQRAPYASSRPGYFDRLFLTAGGGGITFAARVDGDPSDIVDDLRAIVRDIDPGLAVDAAIPMDAVLSGIATRPRFYASLLS